VEWEFDAEVFQWRGPAPYFFVETPEDVDAFLHDHAAELKVALRKPLGIDDGDVVHLQLSVEPDHRRRAPIL
jgi:hypothetical protein